MKQKPKKSLTNYGKIIKDMTGFKPGDRFSVRYMALRTGLSPKVTITHLDELVSEGRLIHCGDGLYQLAEPDMQKNFDKIQKVINSPPKPSRNETMAEGKARMGKYAYLTRFTLEFFTYDIIDRFTTISILDFINKKYL